MKNEIIEKQIDSLTFQRGELLNRLCDINRSSMNSFDSVNDINASISNIDVRIDTLMMQISEPILIP